MNTTAANNIEIMEIMQTFMNKGKKGFPSVVAKMHNLAMQFERELHLGAGRYERTDERRNYANGYKPKTLDTAGQYKAERQTVLTLKLPLFILLEGRGLPVLPPVPDRMLHIVLDEKPRRKFTFGQFIRPFQCEDATRIALYLLLLLRMEGLRAKRREARHFKLDASLLRRSVGIGDLQLAAFPNLGICNEIRVDFDSPPFFRERNQNMRVVFPAG